MSGNVTFRGKPLPRGVVNFVQPPERPRGATINSDGTYACRLPAGQYKVTVTVGLDLPDDFQEGDPLPPPDIKLPAKYGNSRTSGISLDVDGERQFDISLK